MMLRAFSVLGSWLAVVGIAQAEPLPLFTDSEPLKAVLTAPLAQMYQEKRKEERLYYPGHWSFHDSDGTANRLEVKVRTRGVFRRENCRLPPLQLNFRKSEVKDTLFHGQDKLKLVGPCSTGTRNDQLLAVEYLAYQLFAVVADNLHFQTRLLDLSYVDSDQKRKPWTDTTFVIEDESDLAKRLDYKAIKTEKIDAAQLDPRAASIVELFQFMIGNTDFSTIRAAAGRDCCHNVKLLAADDTQQLVFPVPYDFDSSGLVNAPYAKPSEKLPIRKVRQRYFMGRCREGTWLETSLDHFRERREAIMDVINLSPLLDNRTRKDARGFLQGFFDIIADPKQTAAKIADKCY